MEYYKKQVLDDLANKAEHDMYADKDIYEVRDMALMDDFVTGNLTGSYYCNAYKAQETLNESGVLFDYEFIERLKEYGYDVNVLEKGAEWLDVMARCIAIDYINDEDLMKAVKE